MLSTVSGQGASFISHDLNNHAVLGRNMLQQKNCHQNKAFYFRGNLIMTFKL